jgi:soluble lytic murein transglycosylase
VILAAGLSAAAAPAKPAAVPWVEPDGLGPARAAWRSGRVEEAAALAAAEGSPAGALLAGWARSRAGDHQGAAEALGRAAGSPALKGVAEVARAGALRRAGRLEEARAAAGALKRQGVAGAGYLVADVEEAASGCGALPTWQAALAAEPQHVGRHAARQAVLRCEAAPEPRARVVLQVLEDSPPLGLDRALEELVALLAPGAPPLRLPRELLLRLAEQGLALGLREEAGRLLAQTPKPPPGEELARWVLLHGRLLRAGGQEEEAARLVREALAAGVGMLASTLHKSLVDRVAAQGKPEEVAAAYLAVADAFPEDPVGLECRHMGAYHLAEAGRVAEALAQWDVVAAQPGARQQDAAWFAAKAVAKEGTWRAAAERAKALGARWGLNDMGVQARYFAALWTEAAGNQRGARSQWEALCRQAPWRLYGRFACGRVGAKVRPAPPPPAPLPEDAFPLVAEVARHPGLPAEARRDAQAAAALVQAGADAEAREAWRRVVGKSRRVAEPVALLLGEVALAMGDAHTAAILAIRRRGEVKLEADPRWSRLCFPRLPYLEEAAREAGVEPELVHAIARTESLFVADARSSANALGVMQLLPSTGRQVALAGGEGFSSDMLLDPVTGSRWGARFLKMLEGDFTARPELVASGYNAGARAGRRFLERGRGLPLDQYLDSINYRETRGYAKKVLNTVLTYRALAGGVAEVSPTEPVVVDPGTSVGF